MTEKELLKLKDKISTAKDTVNKLEGRLEAARETLQKQWGCATEEIAENKLEALKKQREELQQKIDKKMEDLEDAYALTED